MSERDEMITRELRALASTGHIWDGDRCMRCKAFRDNGDVFYTMDADHSQSCTYAARVALYEKYGLDPALA